MNNFEDIPIWWAGAGCIVRAWWDKAFPSVREGGRWGDESAYICLENEIVPSPPEVRGCALRTKPCMYMPVRWLYIQSVFNIFLSLSLFRVVWR